MYSHKFEWKGLSNTLDTNLIGWSGAYDMSNVSLDAGVLQAARGYELQIAPSGIAWGFGYGSYLGTEEFLAVLGSKVYVAGLNGSSWTQIASGVSQSNWLFQSYASRLFGVNENGGLVYHTIGSNDWSGAGKPLAPGSSGFLYTFERFYGQELNGSLRSISAYTNAASSWSFTALNGEDSTYFTPQFHSAGSNWTTFEFNETTNGHVFITAEIRLPNVDWSFNDRLRVQVKIQTGAIYRVQNIEATLTTATASGTLTPINGQEKTIQLTDKYRDFYFYGSREDRENCTKLTLKFNFIRSGSPLLFIQNDDTFSVGLWLGDVWQNDTAINLDTGPTQATRRYGYSVYDVSIGTESDLSPIHVSVATPSDDFGSYTRVSLTPLPAMDPTDMLRLYRQRVRDGKWVLIGSVLNTGEPWFPPDRNPDDEGTCYVDDHYAEFDLEDLTLFTQSSNLPISYSPQAIGAYNSSLVLGVGPDMAVSKVDLPLEYEVPGDIAPDPDDYTAGRYVFVDPTRSEKVNMIADSEVLFLGTRKKTYMTFGSYPKDLNPPVTVDNNGPIGPRAFSVWGNRGVLVWNAEGLWHMEPNRLSGSNESTISSELITVNLQKSVNAMSPSPSAVVAIHRGDIFIFEGANYLHRSRKTGYWTKGQLNVPIRAAIPDSFNPMRMLTYAGALLKLSGSTYAGSAISWFYQTGNQITPRQHLRSITYVSSGSPTITILSSDGIEGSKSKTYTLDDSRRHVLDIENQIGTDWIVRIEGSTSDMLMDLELSFNDFNGGKAH